MRNRGAALLIFSEELEEHFLLTDHLMVLNEGKVAGFFEPAQYDAETIGRYMVNLPEFSDAA
jgi:simple sugar transport system ATP-binding protein